MGVLEPGLDTNSLTTSETKFRDSCFNAVTAIFPDICPAYLQTNAERLNYDPAAVIEFILNRLEYYGSYIKRPRPRSLKRKRSDMEGDSEELGTQDEVSRAKRKYCHPSRPKGPKENVPLL